MKISKILLLIILMTIQSNVWADDFVPEGETEEKSSADNFVLDADDTGGDVQLTFGETLNEYLQWDNSNLRFSFSDTLRVAGNLEQDGNALTLDADNTGTGANIDIIANQGSDNDGTLRYNSTSNQWEINNDNVGFNPISTFSPQVFDAYDNTGDVGVTQVQTVLNIDTTRVSDSYYTLASDVVTINQDGLYKITGRLTADSLNTSGTQRSSVILQFQLDSGGGFADVPGTRCQDYMREQNNGISSTSCAVSWMGNLSNGDEIRITHQMSGTTTGQTVPQGSGMMIEFIR